MSTSSEPSAAPAAKKKEPKRIEIHLRCDFSEKQLLELARKSADLQNDLEQAEETKKNITSQLKGKVDAISAQIGETAAKIRSGYEIKPVVCELRYNEPEPGLKRTVRLDTYQEVNVEPMTVREREEQLELIKSDEIEAVTEDQAVTKIDDLDFEADQIHPKDDKFTEEECETFAEDFRDIFIDRDSDELRSEEGRIEAASNIIALLKPAELQLLKDWIGSKNRGTILPGKKQALEAIAQAEIRKADRAKLAEEKKKAGRKKVTPGTVECGADEGSRDDAGSEANTKL